jgi:hypothetical protein
MTLANKIPGMKPQDTLWNIAVVLGCVFLIMMALFTIGGGADDPDNGADIEDDESAPAQEEEAEEAQADEEDEETPADENTEADESNDGQAATDGGVQEIEEEPAADSSDGEAESDATAAEESLSEADIETVFHMTIADGGYDVEYAEHEGQNFGVEYTSHAISAEDRAGEIGYFAGAYGVVVDEGHGDNAMRVFGHDSQGTLSFSYFVESEWAQAHHDGEMSDEEYLDTILDTYQEY